MTDSRTPATGTHTTDGIPNTYTSITPFLALADPGAAIEFYREVFGAQVLSVNEWEGHIIHAELQFRQGRIELGAAMPDYRLVAIDPESEDVSVSFSFYCPDVDAVVEKALAAGATLREPVAYFVSGDRFGSIRDPFGVRWSIRTRVEDLSEEESNAQVEAWLARQE